MLMKGVSLAQETLHTVVYPQLAGMHAYEITSEILLSAEFGCVSTKWMVALTFIGLAADAATLSQVPDRFLDTPPAITIECSPYVTEPQQVGVHILSILRHSPEELTKTECVALRQQALKHAGHYHGAIDSIYGNHTVRAEIDAASQHGIDPSDLIQVYRVIATRTRNTPYCELNRLLDWQVS